MKRASTPTRCNVQTGLDYRIREHRTVIGRNTLHNLDSPADVHLGDCRLISHHHFEVHYIARLDRFYVLVRGEAGLFVDYIYLPSSPVLVLLPDKCTFTIPNTQCSLKFEAFAQKDRSNVESPCPKVQCARLAQANVHSPKLTFKVHTRKAKHSRMGSIVKKRHVLKAADKRRRRNALLALSKWANVKQIQNVITEVITVDNDVYL